MDFTCKKYEMLLRALLRQDFIFMTFEEFINNPEGKVIILRHDVDKRPGFALRFAGIETRLGITGSYHFRIVKDSNRQEIIRKIVGMGHELAYHYEDLNLNYRAEENPETNPRFQDAYMSFLSNLEYFRKLYPVKVISMHGSPKSEIDNRELWKIYNYHDAGIICEPYIDIDYSKVLYLTDTGRRWNGQKVNLRDRVVVGFGRTTGQTLDNMMVFKSTDEIINAAGNERLPDKIIINTHPQRWTNNLFWWLTEFLMQNLKNSIKFLIVRRRSNS